MSGYWRYTVIGAAVLYSALLYLVERKTKDFPKTENKWQRGYLFCTPLILLFFAAFFLIAGKEQSVLDAWEKLALMSLLWVLAYIDARTKLIPNRYLILALGIKGGLLVVGLGMHGTDELRILFVELIACLILLLFCFLMRILSKGGLGMGDVKLLSLMPLFLAISASSGAAFYSLLVACLSSCFYLLTRKKGKKDVIPFTPAILTGTVIYLMISNL